MHGIWRVGGYGASVINKPTPTPSHALCFHMEPPSFASTTTTSHTTEKHDADAAASNVGGNRGGVRP
jgi:hypothetical protein